MKKSSVLFFIFCGALLLGGGCKQGNNLADTDSDEKKQNNISTSSVVEISSTTTKDKRNMEYVGKKMPGGFIITKIYTTQGTGEVTGAVAEGNLKVTGKFFTYDDETAYNAGDTCFTADQSLPWRQSFCFSNSSVSKLLGGGTGRAEMVVKEISIPYEGEMEAEVEQVKILKRD